MTMSRAELRQHCIAKYNGEPGTQPSEEDRWDAVIETVLASASGGTQPRDRVQDAQAQGQRADAFCIAYRMHWSARHGNRLCPVVFDIDSVIAGLHSIAGRKA